MHSPTLAQPLARISALDAMRFFPALLVVFCHTGFPELPDPIGALAANGYTAVTFFFLLSGFVLAISYDGAARRFWWARFSRLYPLYALALLLALPRLTAETQGAGGSLIERVALPLAFLQSWSPENATAWNSPAWSLSVEAFLYAIFPATFVLLQGSAIRRLIGVTITCWGIAVALPLLYLALDPDGIGQPRVGDFAVWLNLLRWSPIPHVPVFLMGVSGGLLMRQGARLPLPRLLAAAAAAATILVLLSGDSGPYVLLHNGLLAPLSLAMVLGASQVRPAWLRHPWLVRLGRASYALYITHAPVYFWMTVILTMMAPATAAGLSLAAGVPFAVLFALLAHKWERQSTRALRGLRGESASGRSPGNGHAEPSPARSTT